MGRQTRVTVRRAAPSQTWGTAADLRVGERGQVLPLLILSLMAIIAMAGLLVDGGRAFSDQRQAQAAADTAALAAASAATVGTNPVTAARSVAGPNGFYDPGAKSCDGSALPGGGIQVNIPPTSGSHVGDGGYAEVITTRAMRTGFAGALGMPCWLVSARAVASIATTPVAGCSLCVLGSENTPSLHLQGSGWANDATLRVDGDVYVNKANWYTGTTAVNRCNGSNPCTAASCVAEGDPWPRPPGDTANEDMCGRSMELFNSNGGNILWYARSISVGGGWQARLPHRIHADGLNGCAYHPTPFDWLPTVDNVCIGMPTLVDPLNNPADPGNIVNPPDAGQMSVPVAGENGCPAGARVPTGSLGSPQRLTISDDAPNRAFPGFPFFTICPGIYYGGFSAVGDWTSVKVTMMPGVYYMVGGGASGGGGFVVSGSASIDGSAGVMIYLTGGAESFTENTSPGIGLVPDCDPGTSACVAPTTSGNGNGISSSPTSAQVNTDVQLRLTMQGSPTSVAPTGNVAWYDGQDAIACSSTTPLTRLSPSSTQYRATCTTQFALFGTRGITAVFLGDSNYKPVGLPMNLTVTTSTGSLAGTFNIDTNVTDPCSLAAYGEQCGKVILHAPSTGPYAGLLVFQGRASGLGLTIWPAAGEPACTGNWLTDGVPPNTNPIPAPCGPIGGLQGTIYAPHLKTGGSGDHDAGVSIKASGLADLQIITGTVSMAFDGNMRLVYGPSNYANGRIHLVE